MTMRYGNVFLYISRAVVCCFCFKRPGANIWCWYLSQTFFIQYFSTGIFFIFFRHKRVQEKEETWTLATRYPYAVWLIRSSSILSARLCQLNYLWSCRHARPFLLGCGLGFLLSGVECLWDQNFGFVSCLVSTCYGNVFLYISRSVVVVFVLSDQDPVERFLAQHFFLIFLQEILSYFSIFFLPDWILILPTDIYNHNISSSSKKIKYAEQLVRFWVRCCCPHWLLSFF